MPRTRKWSGQGDGRRTIGISTRPAPGTSRLSRVDGMVTPRGMLIAMTVSVLTGLIEMLSDHVGGSAGSAASDGDRAGVAEAFGPPEPGGGPDPRGTGVAG